MRTKNTWRFRTYGRKTSEERKPHESFGMHVAINAESYSVRRRLTSPFYIDGRAVAVSIVLVPSLVSGP